MKRFLMLVAVAAVAGAMYVAAAPGSRQAVGPTATQFAALKKQVAKLNKTLTALKKDETNVKDVIAGCFLKAGVVPVSQFGDPAGTQGFLYGTPGTPPTASSVRTALDVDASTTTTPGAFIQAVDSSCVQTASAAAHASSGHLLVRAEGAR